MSHAKEFHILWSQPNIGNSFPQQTEVGYYANNVTDPRQQVNFNNIPQHIPEGPGSNENTRNNIGNNPHQIELLYHVTNSRQIDFNNISLHFPEREIRSDYYNRNINSFHGNNTLADNIKQNCNKNDYVRAGLNYGDTDLHNGNNLMTTQATTTTASN
ncbi:hypothetical protein C1646_771893 [Rhizophagus diaphanus]|nr:hypothetical protein C1646_771893 [Rhizophagus diaphanus] [Rhizophagus sp. MUCL 43196]